MPTCSIPRTGLDEPRDILIRDGRIAELGRTWSAVGAQRGADSRGSRQARLPGFVDPHVHFRTPGQEYKENIDTGTAAAAAGGFCQVIAMPNTAPTIDQVSVLQALIGDGERAGARADRLPRLDHDRPAGPAS